MASKSVDHGEVKLGPGWMSLGRKTRNGAPPSVSPSSSTTVLPRVRYTKAELLEVYEPGAPPGLPPNMAPHTGITSVDALVPVNIAADDDLQDILHSNAQSPAGRVKPRGSPPRSTATALSRNRFAPSSPPPANGRSRIGSDSVDRLATVDTVNNPSGVHKNSVSTAFSSVPSSSVPSSSASHTGSTTSSAIASVSTASSAPLSSSSHVDSSSHAGVSTGGGGGTKRPGQVSSSRDFWSGSAVLAPAERPLGASTSERRPLALKPRSGLGANSENGGGGGGGMNGASSSEQYGRSSQQGPGPYWSRAAPRGAADSNSNWRGGPGGGNSSMSNIGGTSGNDSGPGGSTATASAPTSSSVGGGSSHLHPSRGGFGRETRDTFTRNKEALKPTNTRDLSALAKGSNRELSGTSTSLSSHFGNRERESRMTAPTAPAAEKVQQKNAEPVSDSHAVWFYKDPKNETQGPFTGAQIMQWLKERFYDEELLVSRTRETNYRPLAIAFGLRKEDAAPAPPPGFVSGSSNGPAPPPAAVSSSIAPRGSARTAGGNSSRTGRDDRREERRDDRNRRGQKTVEEMAHEVEMMRLEARSKRKAAAPSVPASAIDSDVETGRHSAEESTNPNSSTGSRMVFSDEDITSRTKPVKGPAPNPTSGFGRNDTLDAPGTSDRSMGASPLSDSPGGLPSRSAGPARIPNALHESDLLSKINGAVSASPVARSRFASIMSSSADAKKDSDSAVPVSISQATAAAPPGEHRLGSAVRMDIAGTSAQHSDASKDPRVALPSLPGVVDDTARLQYSPDVAVAPPSQLPSSTVQPQQHENLSQNQDSEASWATVMGDLKQQKNPQPSVSQMPRMAVAASEHDLMALDPAIARASFSRRPAPAPPSSSTMSIPSSTPAPQPWTHPDAKVQNIGPQDIADSNGRVQGMSHSQAPSQSMDQAYARARAQAQAKALAEAHAQAMARHAQAQAQAQAQARAQVQAQRQAQAQAQAGSQAQAQDPAWVYRHRLGQLQSAWDMHCRGQMDASRTLQLARTTAAQHVPGSAEHQRAMMFISNSEAAYNEHTRNMEQIKQAAQHTNMLLLRHQQQQQQQLLAQQQQFSQQLTRQQHVAPQQQLRHQQQMAQLQQQKPQTVGLADQAPGQYTGKSSTVGQYQLPQVEVKEGAGEHRTDDVLDSEKNSAASSMSDLHSTLEQPKLFVDGVGHDKPGVLPTTPKSHKPRTSELSSDAESAVHKGEESGWERVDRKPRNASDPPLPHMPESDSVLDKVSERASASAALSFSSDAPRTPTDTHVLVVSADKDPRKLESMAAMDQREAEEAEAMRRKAATIPAPWVKATPSGGAQNGLSLREIQRQEELRNKAQMAQAQSMMNAQREEAARQAAARQASLSTAPWGSAASVKQRTLSLREQMRLEEEQKQRMAKQNVGTTSVSAPRATRATGSQVQSGTPWASLVASSKPNTSRQTSTVVGKRMGEEGSFWDTVGSAAGKRAMSAGGPSTANSNSRATIARPSGSRQTANPQARATRAVPLQPQQSSQQTQRASRQTASEPTVLNGRVSAEFAKWSAVQLQALTGNDSQDNTFVEYLVSIKSASEIRDTVLQNLGSSDASRAFADEFIRRMEFEKSSESMEHGAGGGGNRKKGRRQRANKVDPSLVLGFTSTSSSSRIMQGTIEKPTMD